MEQLSNDSNLKTAAIKLVNHHPLATIISLNNDAQVIHLPLIYDDQTQCFYGHSAANNALVKSLTSSGQINEQKHNVKLVFTGEHTYVSPTWHPDIHVPTWDYAVVHVSGRLEKVNDQHKQALLAKQIDVFENNWQLEDVQESLRARMLTAITVFKIGAEHCHATWQGKFKLSQNKSKSAKAAILQQVQQQHCTDMASLYQKHWR